MPSRSGREPGAEPPSSPNIPAAPSGPTPPLKDATRTWHAQKHASAPSSRSAQADRAFSKVLSAGVSQLSQSFPDVRLTPGLQSPSGIAIDPQTGALQIDPDYLSTQARSQGLNSARKMARHLEGVIAGEASTLSKSNSVTPSKHPQENGPSVHADASPSMPIGGDPNHPPPHASSLNHHYANPALGRSVSDRRMENATLAMQRDHGTTSMSDMADIQLPRDDAHYQTLLKALLLVDLVHGSGALAQFKVTDRVAMEDGHSMNGNYWNSGVRGPRAEIAVSRDNQHPVLTMIHEIGHHIAKLIGPNAVKKVAEAYAFTRMPDMIIRHGEQDGHSYLLKPEEIFSRAYAQLIVTEAAARNIDREGLEELQRMEGNFDEWMQVIPSDEFAGVRLALVRELKKKFKLDIQ